MGYMWMHKRDRHQHPLFVAGGAKPRVYTRFVWMDRRQPEGKEEKKVLFGPQENFFAGAELSLTSAANSLLPAGPAILGGGGGGSNAKEISTAAAPGVTVPLSGVSLKYPFSFASALSSTWPPYRTISTTVYTYGHMVYVSLLIQALHLVLGLC